MRKQSSGNTFRRRLCLRAFGAALAPLAGCLLPSFHDDAVANGDTRTLTVYHTHTRETTSATFRVNGRYDAGALEKLNWALRDWRRDEPTKIDPRLFDVAWEVQREVGSTQPIQIVSAFRSPETNAMLRRRSSAVAEYSQHMLGKAMDVHLSDVSMAKVREVAMRLQRGGVGYYPTAGTPFVHMDVGNVRYWPRMSRQELTRIFPDGKTVDLPSDGRPMPRYQEALAEIQARGGAADDTAGGSAGGGGKNLFAMLFGGGEDEAQPSQAAAAPAPQRLARGRAPLAAAQSETPPVTSHAKTAEPAVDDRPVARPQLVAQNDATRASDAVGVPVPKPRPADLVAPPTASVPVPPPRPVEFSAAVEALQASARAQAPPRAVAVEAGAAAAASKMKQTAAGSPSSDKPVASQSDGKLTVVALPPSHAPARVALPNVITQGTERPLSRSAALAFAAAPAALSATPPAAAALRAAAARLRSARRKPEFVPARVDRSNFRTLTAAAPTERATTYAAQGGGSALAPMRAAARVNPRSTLVLPSPDVVSHFCAQPYGDLNAKHFSGPAVKALTVADGFATLAVDKLAD